MKQKVIDILLLVSLAIVSVQTQDCGTITRQDVMQVWGINKGAAICTFNASFQPSSNSFLMKVEDTLYYKFDTWIKLERSWKTVLMSED